MNKRVGAVMGFLGAVAVLGAASVAWACTTFSMINLSAASGPASSEVTVKGTNAAANAPVALRWDSRTSAPVAQATADAEGNFTVPVRVPDTGQGVHFLVATDGNGDVARGAFEVTSGAMGGTMASLNSGSSLSASPGSTSAAPNRALEAGIAVLGLGLLASVPVAGMMVLARRPARVAVRVRSSRSEG